VDSAPLTQGLTKIDPHFLVVTGMSTETITVNDPNYESSGGQRVHPRDKLMHACYCESASGMLVAPE
jgi:hypothetical protein